MDTDNIQAFINDEIEAITNACRAYKPKQAPEIHLKPFIELLDDLANITVEAEAA